MRQRRTLSALPGPLPRNPLPAPPVPSGTHPKENPMRGILAWLIGIPIPVIIILYFLDLF